MHLFRRPANGSLRWDSRGRDWWEQRVSLFWKRHKTSITRRDALAGIPILHENVRIDSLSDGLACLKVSLNRGPSFLDRFRPAVMEKKYELDEFGSFVVRQINRERSVLDIVGKFQARFRMTRRESELGVVAFIKMLMQRRVLSVVSGTVEA